MHAQVMDLPDVPFRTRDASSVGLSRRAVHRLRAEGRLVQPVRGVLMPAQDECDPIARAAAVALVLPAGAAVCRGVAAWLHGVDPRAPWQLADPLALECVVPRGCEPPALRGVASHVDLLDHTDVVDIAGLPVTTAERTALDLARLLQPHMALAVLDALAHAGLVDRERLEIRIETWRRQRGVAQARRLIRLCDAKAESFGESWLRLRIIDAGFPVPKTQIWIFDEYGVPLYRLDLGWPDRRIAVEYDGLEFHGSAPARLKDTRRRDTLAKRFRWDVTGVGRGEVLGRSLDLERGIGDLLGMAPKISRRTW
jgi:hypothetical protein